MRKSTIAMCVLLTYIFVTSITASVIPTGSSRLQAQCIASHSVNRPDHVVKLTLTPGSCHDLRTGSGAQPGWLEKKSFWSVK
jgi:hypothetical protein